jgi:hypothetical protein
LGVGRLLGEVLEAKKAEGEGGLAKEGAAVHC